MTHQEPMESLRLLGAADLDPSTLEALLDSDQDTVLHSLLRRVANEAVNPTDVPYAAFESSM